MTRQKIDVAVDSVVFSILDEELSVLLIKRRFPPFKGQYAIPGGFVLENEDLEQAAKRELQEETGVKDIFLQQVGAYGDVKRDPRGRIISIVYLALINSERDIEASTDAADVRWFSVYSLPKLAFDHSRIILDSLKQLRYEIQTTNIAFQILPEYFTLSEMQNLYEKVLDKELDKRNFRKRIKELGIVKSTSMKRMEGAHRPAMLYEFREKTYQPVKDKVHVKL